MLTDSELVLLYRTHINPLYGYVSRRVGADRALAEDIVQEVWLRAVTVWQDRGTPDQPGAWLTRVARNLLASHFRRTHPQPVEPNELKIADDCVSPETLSAATLVNWGLSRLKRRQATLIEAFHFEGKSIREIAKQRGLSERAVEGRLRRARQNLRKHLEPYERPHKQHGTARELQIAPVEVFQPSEGGTQNAQ